MGDDPAGLAAVEGTKVRCSFDNCGDTVSGSPIEPGWIYQFDVFTPGPGGGPGTGGGTDSTTTVSLVSGP